MARIKLTPASPFQVGGPPAPEAHFVTRHPDDRVLTRRLIEMGEFIRSHHDVSDKLSQLITSLASRPEFLTVGEALELADVLIDIDTEGETPIPDDGLDMFITGLILGQV